MIIIFKTTLLAIFSIGFFVTSVHAELKLLSVVFRHGDRAPDNNGFEIYPNDPNVNSKFEPMGYGGLTNNGKMREYRLGEHLRRTYGSFLGDTYYPWEVKARSTNVDRTKMSLQLALAGLYPPLGEQKWNDDLNWQPIPATYVVGLDDVLMSPTDCPEYFTAREEVEASPEFQAKLEPFKGLMDNLTTNSGREIANTKDMNFLYQVLVSETAMNLSIPDWTKEIFPQGQLLEGASLEYVVASYNTKMRRLNGGMLLRKFTDDMTNYKNKVLDQRTKLFLYGGHETTVAAVLQALGIFTPHVPEYSSAVFVELHEENGQHLVKVKYYKGIPSEHQEMPIPGCENDCTLEKLKEVLKDVLPSDEETRNCDKRSLREKLEKGEIKLPKGITTSLLNAIKHEEATRNLLQ